MENEEVLELAHRRCTIYKHVNDLGRYCFSDQHMIDFAKEIERRTIERCADKCLEVFHDCETYKHLSQEDCARAIGELK